VLTTLGAAHQENFRSMEEKCMEKLELMHDTEAMVYCSDNDIISRCIRRMAYKGQKISWSTCDNQATLFVKEVKTLTSSPSHSQITYIWNGEENCYSIPFIDEASIENSITCAAIALHL
jgi:alanine racemase